MQELAVALLLLILNILCDAPGISSWFVVLCPHHTGGILCFLRKSTIVVINTFLAKLKI